MKGQSSDGLAFFIYDAKKPQPVGCGFLAS